MTPVGRLAPSPTGAQHLGNAWTYCLAYAAALSAGGRIHLRIEDIDTPRTKPGADQQAIEDLRWLGLRWSGQVVYQTQRRERYNAVLQHLIDQNLVYPCICSRKDVEASGSAPHFDHEPSIYGGTCRQWQSGDAVPESPHCWRFRFSESTAEFDDLVLGPQSCEPIKHLGDFPVTQKTGDPSYQLAVVVDDHDTGINQVVRGNDLLVSTFRQLAIYKAMRWQPPVHAHVPLIVGEDGRRLAKRHGDTRLSQYRLGGMDASKILHWINETIGLDVFGSGDSGDLAIDQGFNWSRIASLPRRIQMPNFGCENRSFEGPKP